MKPQKRKLGQNSLQFTLELRLPGNVGLRSSMSMSQQAVTPRVWALVHPRAAKESYRRGVLAQERASWIFAFTFYRFLGNDNWQLLPISETIHKQHHITDSIRD